MSGQIYELMPKMMQVLGAIEETNRHQQGWSYRGKTDFLNAIHPVLIQHGCFLVPEVLEDQLLPIVTKTRDGEKAAMYARVKLAVNIYASDGSFVRAVAVGDGQDYEDSSATNAFDRAMRSALEWAFCIPTKQPGVAAGYDRTKKVERASVAVPAEASAKAEAQKAEMDTERAFNLYCQNAGFPNEAARIKAELRQANGGLIDWKQAYAKADAFAQTMVRK